MQQLWMKEESRASGTNGVARVMINARSVHFAMGNSEGQSGAERLLPVVTFRKSRLASLASAAVGATQERYGTVLNGYIVQEDTSVD